MGPTSGGDERDGVTDPNSSPLGSHLHRSSHKTWGGLSLDEWAMIWSRSCCVPWSFGYSDMAPPWLDRGP